MCVGFIDFDQNRRMLSLDIKSIRVKWSSFFSCDERSICAVRSMYRHFVGCSIVFTVWQRQWCSKSNAPTIRYYQYRMHIMSGLNKAGSHICDGGWNRFANTIWAYVFQSFFCNFYFVATKQYQTCTRWDYCSVQVNVWLNIRYTCITCVRTHIESSAIVRPATLIIFHLFTKYFFFGFVVSVALHVIFHSVLLWWALIGCLEIN